MASNSISKKIETGFCTVRLLTDEKRGIAIPIGVAAWDKDRDWYGIRLLGQREKVKGVSTSARTFIALADAHLRKWAERCRVPYAEPGDTPPTSADFWDSVRRIMTTAVRVDAPKAMDRMISNEEELELLFEAIVLPKHEPGEQKERIDSAVASALGSLAPKIQRTRVTAFDGVKERVRGAVGEGGILIIERVNLAARNARRDADALVSRILRLKEGTRGRRRRFIVGYTASPGGLNGERDMKEWIVYKATSNVFDLHRQGSQFQTAAREALEEINTQGILL